MTSAPLADLYHRRVNYLRVSITDRCNLRCTYCMPAEGINFLDHDRILSYEEILRVSRIAVHMGVEKIRITGGEPLVRRGVLSFIERIAGIDGIRDFSLTTNGILLADMAADLRRSGLRRVNVSLDTLKADRFRRITRREGLSRVLEGLAAARKVGLSPIKVNMVTMRGVNSDEILDFADFAQREGYEVRFIEFMPSAADVWQEASLVPAAEILDTLSSRYSLIPVARDDTGGPSQSFLLPDGGKIGVISPLSNHFCGSCNRLRLTAAGHLRSCLFSEEETDLRCLLRSGATDQELAASIRDTVRRKPQRHALDSQTEEQCMLAMSRVGG